jgi:hypothetical protein
MFRGCQALRLQGLLRSTHVQKLAETLISAGVVSRRLH